MSASSEQQAFIDHDHAVNARILAGPGTGKSWTAVQFLERVARDEPGLAARMLTFTRAATAEFAKKLGDADLEGLGVTAPATIHSFALGLLTRFAEQSGLPQPLRIAGKWERRELVRPSLRDWLRSAGYGDVTVRTVRDLEQWMASGWESLDPDRSPDTDLDRGLVNAFTGIWGEHRDLFGYALISEIPYRACQMLEDLALDHDDLDLLLVDEYQDLNKADIRLLELVQQAGTTLVAIGDDDQSIYGFRMAHPEGIRTFLTQFAPARDYPLTESHRCGQSILDPAMALIEADPERGPKQRLTAHASTSPGTFAYLRFSTEEEEAQNIARLVAHRIRVEGVSPDEVAILVRSNVATWARQLAPALEEYGLELASTDWVDEAILTDDELRRGLALAWLGLDLTDSLAWWTLLTQTSGVGDKFIEYVVDNRKGDESFAQILLRLHEDDFEQGPRPSAARAADAIDAALETVEAFNIEGAPADELGWGGWLLDQLDAERITESGRRLIELVGPAVPQRDGLRAFLTQFEPLGNDLAANESDGIRLMTMTGSKGLTVNTAITMGVEEGLVPMPYPRGDQREERRLLFVAMTRATDMCILTWAGRRTSGIAQQGSPSYGARRQSPLLRDLPAVTSTNGRSFIDELLSS